jgi:hypothetical protein
MSSEKMTLYDQAAGAPIGDLSLAQFKVLTTYLRLAGEDVDQPDNHTINARMLDVIEREAQRVGAESLNLPDMGQPKRGARSEARAENMVEVVSLIRDALGDRAEMAIRWEEV